jgi:DNA topoisomerase-1
MQTILSLPHKEIVRLDRNYREVARTVRLLYVSDAVPGIRRLKKGTGFSYVTAEGKRLAGDDVTRVKKLVIPPAWTKVWICSSANGHIQATGYDLRGRKQYRYHTLWNAARNETKFHRLFEFGKSLPALRLRLEEDLGKKDLCQEKVVAAVIALMERTYIRIGNEDYEKLYGSHGITTLKDKHVTIKGSTMRFSFKGKKGVVQDMTLSNRRLARVVKQCRDIPGKELFQYYDAEGTRRSIDSGVVNDYIKDATQTDYTAKDFRTWAGSLNLLRALKAAGEAATEAARKRNILAALDEVSRKLGNTRTVCRNYYVHPKLIELYEQDALNKHLNELDAIELPDGQTELTGDEKLLMKILKSLH